MSMKELLQETKKMLPKLNSKVADAPLFKEARDLLDQWLREQEPPLPDMQPCPWCRSQSLTITQEQSGQSAVWLRVFCVECGAAGPLVRTSDTRKLIEHWNAAIDR